MIVVTGMHRSGTSLAALVLQALGADFGPETALYGADDWNANGYLERIEAVDLNSQLITGHRRTTGRRDQILSQLHYLRMPTEDTIDERARRFESELDALGSALADLTVKDPRFCLTLGGWQRATEIRGLVVALRHPSAAVASLRRRNRLPERLGYRFWRWHMDAIAAHIDERTLVLRQDHLTGPEREDEIDRARRWLADVAAIEPSRDDIDVIDQSLVHHHSAPTDTPPPSLELWERLISLPSFR